jgi:hypothetical protein
MTTRNFNYTGRMLIPQECIDGRINKMSSGPPELEIELDWTQSDKLLDIPDDASVYVDASQDMSFMRFDYGKFKNVVKPSNIKLSDLDSYSSANFVIRVVKEGVLLASSRKHSVTLALPDTKSRRSLIIPEYRDIGERPWMLEVHETIEYPKIIFNEKWWNESLEAGFPVFDDNMAMGVIMPSVLEGMLNWLLIHQKYNPHQLHDDPTWKGAWMRFAKNLVDIPPPEAEEGGEYESENTVSDWIRLVVDNFSKKRSLTSRLLIEYGDE